VLRTFPCLAQTPPSAYEKLRSRDPSSLLANLNNEPDFPPYNLGFCPALQGAISQAHRNIADTTPRITEGLTTAEENKRLQTYELRPCVHIWAWGKYHLA
jgi:hypothetical protein